MQIKKLFLSSAKPLVERLPRIANLYRNLRDQITAMEEPEETPWGFKLAGNRAMARGGHEPEETLLIRELLANVDVLIDVGANIGYYCCHALSLGRKVVAFEPIQRNLAYLYKNIKANGWNNDVEIYPIALSNSIGITEIYGGGTGASLVKGWADIPDSYVTLTPCSTMDKVLGTRFAGMRVLVLVDIEGEENRMLEGAKLMLSNEPKPFWVVEISVAEHQPRGTTINPHLRATFNHFLSRGYEAYTVEKPRRPVTASDVMAVTKGNLQLLNTHNFLFCPAQ